MTARPVAALSVPRPSAPPSSPAPSAPRFAAAGLDRGARPSVGHRCQRCRSLPQAVGRGCDQTGHCPSGLIQAFTHQSISNLSVRTASKFEPVSVLAIPNRDNLTFGRRTGRPHHDPAYGGQGSGGQDHSTLAAFRAMWRLGSPAWIHQDLIRILPDENAMAYTIRRPSSPRPR